VAALETLDESAEYELLGYPHTEIGDCDFLEDVFTTFGHKVKDVLDIACGTGRHAIEMAKRGYAVTGIDISENMLRVAKEKASDQTLQIEFMQKDMSKLDLDEGFDAAYSLFNSLSLITRNTNLIGFMNGVHRSLRKDGLLIVQVGNLWLYIAGNNFKNECRQIEEEKAGIRRQRGIRTIIGPYINIYCHKTDLRYWKDGEELPPKVRNDPQRIFPINEFDLLCRLTKFTILEVFSTTDINERIEDPTRIDQTDKDPKNPFHYLIPVFRKRD